MNGMHQLSCSEIKRSTVKYTDFLPFPFSPSFFSIRTVGIFHARKGVTAVAGSYHTPLLRLKIPAVP